MASAASGRSPDDKRAEILAAARHVCRHRGLGAARMEEIALRARVSKGTLYRFFESKEDLLLAMVLAGYERGRQRIREELPNGGEPRRQLEAVRRGLLRVFPELAPELPLAFQIWGIVTRDPQARTRLSRALREIYAERVETVAEMVRAGQRKGVFQHALAPEAFASTLHAIFDGFLYRAAFDPIEAVLPQLEAALASWIESLGRSSGRNPHSGRRAGGSARGDRRRKRSEA